MPRPTFTALKYTWPVSTSELLTHHQKTFGDNLTANATGTVSSKIYMNSQSAPSAMEQDVKMRQAIDYFTA